MSFNVTVIGHSPDPHNEVVKAAAVAFADSLKEAIGPTATVTLSGYSGDSTGYITFGDADRPSNQKAEEAPTEEAAETPAVETAEETPAEEAAPAEEPAAPAAPAESAPTTPAEGA